MTRKATSCQSDEIYWFCIVHAFFLKPQTYKACVVVIWMFSCKVTYRPNFRKKLHSDLLFNLFQTSKKLRTSKNRALMYWKGRILKMTHTASHVRTNHKSIMLHIYRIIINGLWLLFAGLRTKIAVLKPREHLWLRIPLLEVNKETSPFHELQSWSLTVWRK